MKQHAVASILLIAAVIGATGCGPTQIDEAETAAGVNVEYVVRRTLRPPTPDEPWSGPNWKRAGVIDIARYHPQSSDHRPTTQAKLLYDDDGLYVHFRVEDRYVLSRQTKHQGTVATDSCVEFFFQPRRELGVFTIETNCGGAMLFWYVEDAGHQVVPLEDIERMRIYHTMPKVVDPEITDPVTWRLTYFVPFDLLARYLGEDDVIGAAPWWGNLFKGVEASSHPHWGAWQDIGETLSFGQRDKFARIGFEQ